MKFFVIFLFVVWAEYTKVKAVNDEIQDTGVAQAYFLDYLSSLGAWRCYSHRHDLQKRDKKAVECVKNIRYDSSFCSTFLKSFKPCVEPLLQRTGQCEDPFDNALKNAVVDVVMAEIKYLCDADGSQILEILNPCAVKSALQGYDCKTKIMQPYQRSKNLTEVCSVFPNVLKCFEDEMKTECPNKITRTALHEFFTVDVKPCNIAIEGYVELLKFISS